MPGIGNQGSGIGGRGASLGVALLAAADAIARMRSGASLERALAAVATERQLGVTERAAAQDLSFTAARLLGTAQWLRARLTDKPTPKPLLAGLLDVALALWWSRKYAPHTLVNQAVDAAAGHAHLKAAKGMVNAVLRRALREEAALRQAAAGNDGAHWNFPPWWLARVRAAYPQDWQPLLTQGNAEPPLTLRLNRRHTNPQDWLKTLAVQGSSGIALSAYAVQLTHPVPVTQLPGFAQGHVSVQDWGAQQAAHLLDVADLAPSTRVLDACAAPGGKTCHLLELADLDLTALDSSAARLQRVQQNLDRQGVPVRSKVKLIAANAVDLGAWWDGQPFARILLDAPCSGSGVTKRHPDIKWLRRNNDITALAKIQAELCVALWQTLAPGGKMLYVTCSVFPDENLHVIQSFLAQHADAVLHDCTPALAQLAQPMGGLALLPTPAGTQLLPCERHDGFFYALLHKAS